MCLAFFYVVLAYCGICECMRVCVGANYIYLCI